MKNLKDKNAILTGASGGLGQYMAEELANSGINLFMVAYPGHELPKLAKQLSTRNIRISSLVADLRKANEVERVVEQSLKDMGHVDILINNAGIEYTAPFHTLDWQIIEDVINLNLLAAMKLTRFVLPGMLERHSGHIVNISSLAGKAGPALQESYAASKAGLIQFTASLRGSYRNKGISASVIVPGFVEAGIYTRLKEESGCTAPILLGTSRPQKVAKKLIEALVKDLPEVVINPYPVKPLFAIINLLPRIGELIVHATGAHSFFKKVWNSKQDRALAGASKIIKSGNLPTN